MLQVFFMAKEDFKVSDDKEREEEDIGLDESNIYDKEARSTLIEEDEISLKEAAFMEGYDNAESFMEEED